MSGSLLGPDQVKKINAALPRLVDHIRTLLAADHTGVGLMRAHLMVESFDSDEMFKVFQELSFISPREKLALVRAAIYELMAREPALFISPTLEFVSRPFTKEEIAALDKPVEKVFSPPQFRLNVVTSGAEEIAKTDTKPTPPPATSTHTSKIAERIEAGDKAQAEQRVQLSEAAVEAVRKDQEKFDAAVAKLRESGKPTPIAIPSVPEDAVIPQE